MAVATADGTTLMTLTDYTVLADAVGERLSHTGSELMSALMFSDVTNEEALELVAELEELGLKGIPKKIVNGMRESLEEDEE